MKFGNVKGAPKKPLYIKLSDRIPVFQVKAVLDYGNRKDLSGIDHLGLPYYTSVKPDDDFLVYNPKGPTVRNYINNVFHKANRYSGYVGCDPEIFVENDKGLMPAFDFLPAKSKGTTAYWDGFQAEFITRENMCLSYHIDSIQYGLLKVLESARKVDPTAKLSLKTVVDVGMDAIAKAAPEHVAFGCMPSFNAYGHEGLKVAGQETSIRCTGGHIHFGLHSGYGSNKPPFDKGKVQDNAVNIVKALDAILGVMCVSLFKNIDDPKRRMLYGLAGEYRLPAHGIEYRTLSNAWLCHPVITNLVFDMARAAFSVGHLGDLGKMWKATEEETIECINNCNADMAKVILERNKNCILGMLDSRYFIKEINEKLYDVILNGVETLVLDVNNIEGNWQLGKKMFSHASNQDIAGQKKLIIEGKKVA